MLLVLLSAFLSGSAPAAENRPNIVLFLVDDLGWSDLGCYGSDFYRTPQIDRLAREGVRFTQAYAAAPVCSPTRACLLTGKSPARLHLTDWLPGRPDRPDQKMSRPQIEQQLPLEEVTLAEELKKLGYSTAHIGKWHLGGAGFEPEKQGFDVNIAGDASGTPISYFHPYRNEARVMPGLSGGKSGEYLTDRLTDEAVRFVKAQQGHPFFLHLAHYAVHIPLAAKQSIVEQFRASTSLERRHTNAHYAAMIASVDESVGRIVTALKDTGAATNTIFVFTSDNGGLSVAEGPNTPATSNAPLRAGKGHLHEGGLRVPWIVWAPGRIKAGESESTPIQSADFLPTVLEAVGAQSSAATNSLDGESLWPVLSHSGALRRQALHWHYPHYSNQGGKPGGAIREGDLKLIENYDHGFLELYNLALDPAETRNIAGENTDKANALQKKLADWRKQVGAQSMRPNTNYVLVPIQPQADGSILLHGKDVTIHGVNVRYEPPAHKNTVGFWTKVEDWISWDFEVRQPGTYSLEIWQGCGKGSGGSEVEFSVGEQTLRMTVEDTGHFQNFKQRTIGELQFAAPGRYQLQVRPKTKPGVAVMDVRQMMLKPLK